MFYLRYLRFLRRVLPPTATLLPEFIRGVADVVTLFKLLAFFFIKAFMLKGLEAGKLEICLEEIESCIYVCKI